MHAKPPNEPADLEPANGTKKLPEIVLSWDPRTQDVNLRFDSRDFRQWDFVLMILEGAKLKAQALKVAAQMAAMQQQAVAQAQDERIRRQIIR